MHYRRANELSVQCAPPHDSSGLSRTVDLIIRSQDRTWVTRSQSVGNPSQLPVFIIGMLRSGTTLAEQILASHPEVFGAGELTYFGTRLPRRIKAPQPPAPNLTSRTRNCIPWA